MDVTSPGTVTFVAGVLIVVGMIGIVFPVIPGLILCWLGVLLWAAAEPGALRWVVFGIATVLIIAGTAAKYALPGKNLRNSGVPWSTIASGTVLGVVGFFVVPVIGLFLGFVLGIYLAERHRLGNHTEAWPATKTTLKAVGLGLVIELATAQAVLLTWLVGVLVG